MATRYSIRGIEPPDLYRFPDDVRKLFWGWVVELGIKAKAKDVIAGLDKDGQPLKAIKPKTRKNRKSAMTPSGKGDPAAPPLIPGWQKSRTYSLLYGTAFVDHAEFGWRFDAWTGKQWGKILAFQAQHGRDTIGLSPDGIARVKVQAWSKWAQWKAGTLKEPAARKPIAAAPVVGVGRPVTPDAVFGIGANAPPTGQFSGGMTQKEWAAYFRGQARAAPPGRPTAPPSRSPITGPGYNRILQHIWGQPGSRPGRGPGSAAPVPARPRPTPALARQAAAVKVMAKPIARPAVIASIAAKAESFPELVHRAIAAVPEEKLYTREEYGFAAKAWIHDVWAEFVKIPGTPKLTLEQFKAVLADDTELRAFMTRADMVGAMNPADVAASMVRAMSGGYEMATWNFLIRRKKKA